MIREIPDNLLQRYSNPGQDEKRKHKLQTWCERRSFRPMFLAIENERERRGLTKRI